MHIDHPLDPENKYLVHSGVVGAEALNFYNGNIVTDANGEAVVALPAYVETLNIDFRYQLTVINQFAQAIIAGKIKANHFIIKTDKPNVEVSWQVTGVRNDAYMRNNPSVVEPEKHDELRGTYLHPEYYGQPETKRETYPVTYPMRQFAESVARTQAHHQQLRPEDLT